MLNPLHETNEGTYRGGEGTTHICDHGLSTKEAGKEKLVRTKRKKKNSDQSSININHNSYQMYQLESSHGRGCTFCAKKSLGAIEFLMYMRNCRSMKYFAEYILCWTKA